MFPVFRKIHTATLLVTSIRTVRFPVTSPAPVHTPGVILTTEVRLRIAFRLHGTTGICLIGTILTIVSAVTEPGFPDALVGVVTLKVIFGTCGVSCKL